MGWLDGQGKDVQAHICRAFAADVILVIGDDKLHSAMQMLFQVSCRKLLCAQSKGKCLDHAWGHKAAAWAASLLAACLCSQRFALCTCCLPLSGIADALVSDHLAECWALQGEANTEVVKLPKSGGTVQRTREYHKFLRDLSIKQYFLGRSGEMQPALHSLKLSTIKLFKVPGSMTAGSGLLPASMAASVDQTRLTPVDVTPDLVCSCACGLVQHIYVLQGWGRFTLAQRTRCKLLCSCRG